MGRGDLVKKALGVTTTTVENLPGRLYFRFLVFYFWGLIFSLIFPLKYFSFSIPQSFAFLEALFVPLALLGALLAIFAPYLSLLTIVKSFFDALLLRRVALLLRNRALGFWPFNATFFLLLAGIFLYTAAAEKGCYFAFFFRERNFRLIFSKHFGCYLLISLILSVCSLVLFLLWSRLMDAIPLIT